MAGKSIDRKRHEGEIVRLASQGMSQRAIAMRLGVSRPLVQRVLDAPTVAPAAVPDDAPDDFGEVQADFNQLAESARAANSLDEWRRLHEVAKTCYENGYRVSYNPLPFLMVLHGDDGGVEYAAEIKAVYAWMREAGVGNYKNTN